MQPKQQPNCTHKLRVYTCSKWTLKMRFILAQSNTSSSRSEHLLSYRVKQWWHTALAYLLDTQQASGSAEVTSSPLLIRVVARRPLPFPGLTKRSIGAITASPSTWSYQCLLPYQALRHDVACTHHRCHGEYDTIKCAINEILMMNNPLDHTLDGQRSSFSKRLKHRKSFLPHAISLYNTSCLCVF